MKVFYCDNYISKIKLEVNFNGDRKKALSLVEFQNTNFS